MKFNISFNYRLFHIVLVSVLSGQNVLDGQFYDAVFLHLRNIPHQLPQQYALLLFDGGSFWLHVGATNAAFGACDN